MATCINSNMRAICFSISPKLLFALLLPSSEPSRQAFQTLLESIIKLLDWLRLKHMRPNAVKHGFLDASCRYLLVVCARAPLLMAADIPNALHQ